MGGIRSVCQRQQVLPFQDGAAFDADETAALLWSKQEWFLPEVGQWSMVINDDDDEIAEHGDNDDDDDNEIGEMMARW